MVSCPLLPNFLFFFTPSQPILFCCLPILQLFPHTQQTLAHSNLQKKENLCVSTLMSVTQLSVPWSSITAFQNLLLEQFGFFFLSHSWLPLLCLISLLLTHHTHQAAFNALFLAKAWIYSLPLTPLSPSGTILFLKSCVFFLSEVLLFSP